eukprot:TRINITY_DN14340_c0_g1_i1.p1 TRINITY_DN14340_c0_g1~~TRINITY_DN14340_c0_g1_i1.p1  ORF type:complete len:518 (+),score=116.48 TRINITY_DN14340_c0_g1_i1:70-1623(+)
MITPRFSCTQDHNFVIIIMRLVHVKISDVQFVVDGKRITFTAKPYFLRLTFDQEVIEDERAKATFDVDKEEMKVLVPKKNPGEIFTDLDCLTKLLSTEIERKKLIEVLPGDESEDEEEEDYEARQNIANTEGDTNEFYGFNDEFSNFFAPIQDSHDIAECKVDSVPLDKRVEMMLAAEAEDFINGSDHYLADYMEGDHIKELLTQRPTYYTDGMDPPSFEYLKGLGASYNTNQATGQNITCDDDADEDMDSQSEEETESSSSAEPEPAAAVPQFINPGDIGRTEFTTGGALSGYVTTANWDAKEHVVGEDERENRNVVPVPENSTMSGHELTTWEKEELLRLPKKNHLVVKEQEVMCTLIDLLAAYCYDHITTEGEGNTESVWTYTKLSATLSYVVKYPSPKHAVVSFYRRSVTYPIHRSIVLSKRCLFDVAHILSSGDKMKVVRILLRMKWHVDRDDFKHPLSKLYLAPYAVWLQTVSPDFLRKWGSALTSAIMNTTKADIGLPLEDIESFGDMTG